MKSPIVLLTGLWTDVQRLEPDVKGLNRDLITIKKRYENEGYGFLSIALPSLCDSLDRGLATGQFSCPPGFKTTRGGTIPALMQGMFREVFEPLTGHLKAQPNFGVVKLLRQVLKCFKKIQLDDEDSLRLHSKAVAEFYQNDVLAGSVIFPDTEAHYLGVVCSMLMSSLSSVELNTAEFKHGPGAVFEGYRGNQKWDAVVDFLKNEEIDVSAYGFDDFCVSLLETEERHIVTESTKKLYFDDRASRRSARLISVPKNSTSRRTITVEPLVNQFVQQGLNIVLRESIRDCPILSNSLALTDQSKNQQLALEGSLLDNWATIDLKSASDLMSVKLVELVFGRHGLFFDQMMDCRSPSVICDDQPDQTKSLWKFAGMGNALTFPVQSICFTAICLAAICQASGGLNKPSFWSVKRASRHIRVFGDDIIVSTRYARQCVIWLEMFGLKVNHRKSFLGGNFKESCGVDAFKGVDVTPIYVRHRPDQPSEEPSVIAGLVSTCNQLWLSCLYSASATLQEEIESRLKERLPLVSRSSGALGWHTRLDAMNPSRWNHNLQMFETRALALTSLKRRDRLDGYGALLKFFMNPRLKDDEEHLGHLTPLVSRVKDHLEHSSIRYKNRIVRKWVPTKVG